MRNMENMSPLILPRFLIAPSFGNMGNMENMSRDISFPILQALEICEIGIEIWKIWGIRVLVCHMFSIFPRLGNMGSMGI